MVVLSAAIMSRNGKVLVARQFVPMTKLRIEGLLAAFPKLVGTGGGQHTFIETENVRYLYQPIEQLYALLVTNKQSNIMEDLETLRLVAKLIPEYCHGQDEGAVVAHAFPLVYALDEVISMGYRENLTLQQVRTFTEMDSHEEKLQNIIQKSKEDEAAAKAKDHAKEIAKRKLDAARMNGGAMARGFGGGSMSSSSMMSSAMESSGAGAGSNGGYDGVSAAVEPEVVRPKKTRDQRLKAGGLGLQLGQKKAGDDLVARMADEEHLPASPAPLAHRAPDARKQTAQAAPTRHVDGVLLVLNEDLKAEVERDGTLKKMVVNGTLALTIVDPDYAKLSVQTSLTDAPKGLRFQLHPKIDRGSWAKSKLLTLKTVGKGFPVGALNSASILKWKLLSDDMALCPLTLNFWPSEENGKMVVNVEYTCESESISLQDVKITIPCTGVHSEPEVTSVNGSTYFDVTSNAMIWSIDEVRPGDNGVLDFVCDCIDTEDMYPLSVSFTSSTSLCGLGISAVTTVDTSESCDFETDTTVSVSSFTMQ